MPERKRLTAQERATLDNLRARAFSPLGWFTLERAGRHAFVRPYPADNGEELPVLWAVLEALEDGGYIEVHEEAPEGPRFRLRGRQSGEHWW